MTPQDMHNWMWGEALSLLEQADRLQRESFDWKPPVDVVESSDALFVQVALPGVSADSIVVSLELAAVTVSATRAFPINARGARLHRVEIPHGRFSRRIPLPLQRLEPMGRSYIDGCLTLAFRKIAVQPEQGNAP